MILCTYLQHHNIFIKHFISALNILIVIHLSEEKKHQQTLEYISDATQPVYLKGVIFYFTSSLF